MKYIIPQTGIALALVSFAFLLTLQYQNVWAPPINCVGSTPCNGTNANDYMVGDDGANRMNGQGGYDLMEGNDGNDEVSGGEFFDEIYGGDGDDALDGGEENDEVSGGAGNDEVSGGAGIDDLRAGRGNDEVSGGAGNDEVSGGAGNDEVSGGDDDDTIYHGPPYTRAANATGPDGSRDIIDCGPGNDTAYINSVDRDVVANCETVYNERDLDVGPIPEGLLRGIDPYDEIPPYPYFDGPKNKGTDAALDADTKDDGSAKEDDGGVTGNEGADVLDGDDKILPEK